MSKQYLAQGTIVQNHVVLLLGQPHNGKSWILDDLTISVASGTDFLSQLETKHGSSIIIDEDTPTDTLYERLERLCVGRGIVLNDLIASNRLKVYSQTNFQLDDTIKRQNILNDIKTMAQPVFVAIDSLARVCFAKIDKPREAMTMMSYIGEFKREGATPCVTHHLTLKKELKYDDWDVTKGALDSTYIISQCDTAFATFRIPPKTQTVFAVVPHERRTKLDIGTEFGVKLYEDKTQLWVRLDIMPEIPKMPSENERRIFPLFRDDQLTLAVADVMTAMQKDLSERDIRNALHELETHDCLIREVAQGSAHRYKYKLHPDFANQFALTTEYRDFLRN